MRLLKLLIKTSSAVRLRKAALCSLTLCATAGAATRPNIVLVVTDDQGYWDTGVSGNPKIDTPTIDAFARHSVSFSHCYAEPVCAPTRAGLMTGRHYLRTGLYNTRYGGDSLGLNEVTLAELLKAAGYRTGIFGKWHLGGYAGYQPMQRGFDEFLGFYHGHIEHYDYPDQLVHNGQPTEAQGYITNILTDAAIDFIATPSKDPFFCYLAYNAPHSPYVVGSSHNGQPDADRLINKYLRRGLALHDARIYAMVETIDRNFGRLLEMLDQRRLRDNTIVVFLSDNGGVSHNYNAGLRGGKASPWEGGVRVPCFVNWPSHFPAGATVDAQITLMDFLPTFCDLLELDVPQDRPIDGRSILSLLKDGKGDSPHPYVYHTWDRFTPNPHNRWSIGDGRYKLVGNDTRGQAEPAGKLFDLQNDPAESIDIAAANAPITARLRSEFLRWFAEVTAGQKYQPVPIPVGAAEDPLVELQPSWARLSTKDAKYSFEGYDWDTISKWDAPGDSAAWRLAVAASGEYELIASYGCAPQNAGGKFVVRCGEERIEASVFPTPTANIFERRSLGTLKLQQGDTTLVCEVAEADGELMHLNRLWLRRVEPLLNKQNETAAAQPIE